jgi:hypothetical protein
MVDWRTKYDSWLKNKMADWKTLWRTGKTRWLTGKQDGGLENKMADKKTIWRTGKTCLIGEPGKRVPKGLWGMSPGLIPSSGIASKGISEIRGGPLNTAAWDHPNDR